MGIRLVIAAVMLAVGIGQADAATVESRSGWFTLTSLEVFCGSYCSNYPDSRTKYYAGLREGQTALGQVTISTSDDGEMVYLSMRYGPTLSTYLFSEGLTRQENGTYSYDSVYDVPCCYRFRIGWNGRSGWFRFEDDDPPIDKYVTINFEIAAVPLPASAALLPIGMGALAMVRKRKRAKVTKIVL
ncbi:VPLPA-CTERM sorting domain-containing protein [Paracoccus fistulariae]|nr:VPLPA-CTERM sorting domain-containing protein [Paracoccus fistulariae]MDB6181238.1 VPLPA-CTERM sorting domain-containing protein [Paracoccus fistulariae]